MPTVPNLCKLLPLFYNVSCSSNFLGLLPLPSASNDSRVVVVVVRLRIAEKFRGEIEGYIAYG